MRVGSDADSFDIAQEDGIILLLGAIVVKAKIWRISTNPETNAITSRPDKPILKY
ncbi:MAG: hypothetical protein ACRD38_04180 [Nitrososphaerales archaeon]